MLLSDRSQKRIRGRGGIRAGRFTGHNEKRGRSHARHRLIQRAPGSGEVYGGG